MRVLHINTSDWGDETAVAANRLMEALKNNGIKAKMLVRHKRTEQITVAEMPESPLSNIRSLRERFSVWKANRFRNPVGCRIDAGYTGSDITSLPEFTEADVIHLHDTTGGCLSLKNIRRIAECGKPVVWTMHDMWPFTGVCHHSDTCTRYRTACKNCPMLHGNGAEDDLSAAAFRCKQQMLHGVHILFVASTGWIENAARQSALLTGQEIVSVPNTVCTHTFYPTGKKEARLRFNLPADKKLLLWGTFPADRQPGDFDKLSEVCRILKEKMGKEAAHTAIVMPGEDGQQIKAASLPFPVYAVGNIANDKQLAQLYNATDACFTLSPESGRSALLMGAMACGVPCVGFDAADIPELIVHKQNGYLAEPHSAEDFAEGMRFVSDIDMREQLSSQAVHKILSEFGETNIASRYIALYHRITNQR